tara:strand:- start:389 stop:547 length:159 start_codon:yes stop_codon:yes gene_type:complete
MPYRIRDIKNDTIVVDSLASQVDAQDWVDANVSPPNEEGKLEIANAYIEEYI